MPSLPVLGVQPSPPWGRGWPAPAFSSAGAGQVRGSPPTESQESKVRDVPTDRFWSAAACCRFRSGQLAGRALVAPTPRRGVSATSLRASSQQKSGSKLPHSRAPAVPASAIIPAPILLLGASSSVAIPGDESSPQGASDMTSHWLQGTRRLFGWQIGVCLDPWQLRLRGI